LRRADEPIARAAAAIAAIDLAQTLLANMLTAQYAFRPPSIASSPAATPVPNSSYGSAPTGAGIAYQIQSASIDWDERLDGEKRPPKQQESWRLRRVGRTAASRVAPL
jgi:hypothetical protein